MSPVMAQALVDVSVESDLGPLCTQTCGYVAAAGCVQAQPQQLPQIRPIKRN